MARTEQLRTETTDPSGSIFLSETERAIAMREYEQRVFGIMLQRSIEDEVGVYTSPRRQGEMIQQEQRKLSIKLGERAAIAIPAYNTETLSDL